MIKIRAAEERGAVNMGWLDARHSFSFGDYYDPAHMGFGSLRVINEDRIEPAQGFGTHGHKNMEIITYMIEGALEHKDNMGNGSVIHAGDVQRMSAGTGVLHSEFNHSATDMAHLLQIWILPNAQGITPGWEEKNFTLDEKHNVLRLIASDRVRDGALKIHQHVDLFASVLDGGATVSHELATGHRGWLQLVRGQLALNGEYMKEGDGAAIEDVDSVQIRADSDAEFLFFDMRSDT